MVSWARCSRLTAVIALALSLFGTLLIRTYTEYGENEHPELSVTVPKDDGMRREWKPQIMSDDHGNYLVTLTQDHPWFTSLQFSAERLEADIQKDTWLIMWCAVWSMSDIANIQEAAEACAAGSGKWRLGVRPFDRYDEIRALHGDVNFLVGPTPVWLVLVDGHVTGVKYGVLTAGEITAFVEGS